MTRRKRLSWEQRLKIEIHLFTPMEDRLTLSPAWPRLLRVHHWSKNVLVYLPLCAAHRWSDAFGWLQATQAVLAFCLLASAVYILNDLLDCKFDSAHPDYRFRPIASGEIGWGVGLITVFALLGMAIFIARFLPMLFWGAAGAYLLGNVAYSLYFKRVVFMDVILLAAFYTIRLFAGGAATHVPISHWLLVFSMFFFLGLALLKRLVQLSRVPVVGGIAYSSNDRVVLVALGTAASMASLVILALYISGEAPRLYGAPERLWYALPPLFFWLARLWLVGHRGDLSDPILFTLNDRVSYGTALVLMGVFLWAM